MKKEIKVKKSKIEKQDLPEISFDVNDDGDVVSIRSRSQNSSVQVISKGFRSVGWSVYYF